MAWYDSLPKIKFPTGTVGKICYMVVAASISLAVMVLSVREAWVACVGMILLTIVVLVLGLRSIWFADKHPQAALMEGAQFLRHEEIEVERTKFTPARVVTDSEKTEKSPLLLTNGDRRLLSQPEEEKNG